MILNMKKPLTFEEQVKQLVKHKMDVTSEELAVKVLSEINYYRFTGYAFQFRDNENPDDYLKNTSFETVLQLYCFDQKLRWLLKPFLDIVEIYARTQIAYGFSMSKCIESPYNQHYDPTNFHHKSGHGTVITDSLNREKVHNKDSLFVAHHSNKYGGKMPLWVIVELLSFTNLSKLYSAMYYSEQDKIASAMGTSKETLRNHLHCLANLRNKVAHAGRLYNAVYNPPVSLGKTYRQKNQQIMQDSLFAYIIALMRRLSNKTDRITLAKEIHELLENYSDCVDLALIGFPHDYVHKLNEITIS